MSEKNQHGRRRDFSAGMFGIERHLHDLLIQVLDGAIEASVLHEELLSSVLMVATLMPRAPSLSALILDVERLKKASMMFRISGKELSK